MAQTTIAVVPRDRFSEDKLTTSSVLGPPPAGFRQVVVDVGYVALSLAEIEQGVRSRSGGRALSRPGAAPGAAAEASAARILPLIRMTWMALDPAAQDNAVAVGGRHPAQVVAAAVEGRT